MMNLAMVFLMMGQGDKGGGGFQFIFLGVKGLKKALSKFDPEKGTNIYFFLLFFRFDLFYFLLTVLINLYISFYFIQLQLEMSPHHSKN